MRGIFWWQVAPIIGSLTYAIPLIAAVRRGVRTLPAPLRIVAYYCAITLFEGCVMVSLALQGKRNLWLIHVFTPIEVILLLLAFSHWQVRESARTMILLTVPLFVVTWVFLIFSTDSPAGFPVYGRTLAALLILTVAAYTLLTQAQSAATFVSRLPWFWISVGILVYFPFLVLLNPISAALMDRRDLILSLYQLNAVLMMGSNLFFRRAILCLRHPSSGGPSSPRPSPA